MTLNSLICRANSVYPDDAVLQCWDVPRAKPKDNPNCGDALAAFIVREIAATFDPNASDDWQIATAAKAMQDAANDLSAIAHSFDRLENERLAA